MCMKVEKFIEELSNVLEVAEGEIKDENSMLQGTITSVDVLTIIALCDELFSQSFTTRQLWSITTVKSLMELIGMDNFEQ